MAEHFTSVRAVEGAIGVGHVAGQKRAGSLEICHRLHRCGAHSSNVLRRQTSLARRLGETVDLPAVAALLGRKVHFDIHRPVPIEHDAGRLRETREDSGA